MGLINIGQTPKCIAKMSRRLAKLKKVNPDAYNKIKDNIINGFYDIDMNGEKLK